MIAVGVLFQECQVSGLRVDHFRLFKFHRGDGVVCVIRKRTYAVFGQELLVRCNGVHFFRFLERKTFDTQLRIPCKHAACVRTQKRAISRNGVCFLGLHK